MATRQLCPDITNLYLLLKSSKKPAQLGPYRRIAALFTKTWYLDTNQRTLTLGESITVRLVYSFTSLDSTASLYTNNIFFCGQIQSC